MIGIDSHKDTLACCDAAGSEIGQRSIPNTAHEHAELVACASATGCARVRIEGPRNYSRPAAQALLAAGAAVVEVPSQITAAARRAHPLQHRPGARR